MRTTRRGALAIIAGSSLAIVTETLGVSRTDAERPISVEVASDEEAYLQLTNEGLAGVFGDDRTYESPHEIVVYNALETSLEVTFASPAFAFEPGTFELGPGESTAVEVTFGDSPKEPTTGPIDVVATDDATVAIDAVRELSLEPKPEIGVDDATLTIDTGGSGPFVHTWHLSGLRLQGETIEKATFDYGAFGPGTDVSDPDSVTVGGEPVPDGRIDGSETELTLDLGDDAPRIGEGDVELSIALDPSDGTAERSPATLALVGERTRRAVTVTSEPR